MLSRAKNQTAHWDSKIFCCLPRLQLQNHQLTGMITTSESDRVSSRRLAGCQGVNVSPSDQFALP